jgi:hypothetical protein
LRGFGVGGWRASDLGVRFEAIAAVDVDDDELGQHLAQDCLLGFAPLTALREGKSFAARERVYSFGSARTSTSETE